MLKSIAAGLMAALLLGPVLAQAQVRPGQASVPRLDGVQTPGPARDNQTGSGPRSSLPEAYFGTVPRLDGVQTPGPVSDNRTGSGPLNARSGANVSFDSVPRLDGVPTPGVGRDYRFVR